MDKVRAQVVDVIGADMVEDIGGAYVADVGPFYVVVLPSGDGTVEVFATSDATGPVGRWEPEDGSYAVCDVDGVAEAVSLTLGWVGF